MENISVDEVVQKLRSMITEEVVKTAVERYGDVGAELLTYAIAFDVSATKMPRVYEASSKAQRKIVSDLLDEVDELKELLDDANMRVEELSTTQVNASQVENGVLSSDESSVKVEKSFVEELEKELEQKYL
jgi:hypothetical protein